jgi:ABC-type lipoprotein release transport system permease subunit
MLLGLAWRNIWRRPQRTMLSLVSVALVSGLLVFLLSFQMGVYDVMKQSVLHIFDGYAQIQPEGYQTDPAIDRAIDHPASLIRLAVAQHGISTAAPRINGFALLSNGPRTFGAAVIGVDPENEPSVSAIPGAIREGRYLTPSDDGAAVLGEALARNLAVSVGGKVTLLGSARDGSVAADVLRVVGIYRTGATELDRDILEMPLSRAEQTFAMDGGVNTIALGGPTLTGVDAALPSIAASNRQRGVSVLDWTALEPSLRDTIAMKWAFSFLFYLTLVVVVAFIILNTLLMSVLERTREFGTLLAIGMRPRLIGIMVWLELLMLALFGSTIGLALGAAVTLWFTQHGIQYPQSAASILAQFGMPTRLYPTLSALSATIGPGGILLTILLGGIVPYLHVRGLTAASAMRTG